MENSLKPFEFIISWSEKVNQVDQIKMKSSIFIIAFYLFIISIFSTSVISIDPNKNTISAWNGKCDILSNVIAPFIARVTVFYNRNRILRECLSTIISKNVVVTSSSCVDGIDKRNILVFPNLQNLTNQYYRRGMEIDSRVEKSPQRNRSRSIVLLKLKESITIGTKARIVSLPTIPGKRLMPGGSVTAIGNELFGNRSNTLQQTELKIVKCQEQVIPIKADPTSVCAASFNVIGQESADICGLAGTPILINKKKDKGKMEWELRGIYSFRLNSDCPSLNDNSQAGFTEILHHLDWIKENIRRSDRG